MKIGVVSDTHSRPLPKQLLDEFKGVDMIIHAGDFCAFEDAQKFLSIKNLKAVFGNMDDYKIRQLFPETQIIDVEGVKIGVFHGEGSPKTVLNSVKDKFKGKGVDILIFGHSHVPLNEKQNGILYFNPGSPNDLITAPYCSYGIIEIDNKNIKANIIKIKD